MPSRCLLTSQGNLDLPGRQRVAAHQWQDRRASDGVFEHLGRRRFVTVPEWRAADEDDQDTSSPVDVFDLDADLVEILALNQSQEGTEEKATEPYV